MCQRALEKYSKGEQSEKLKDFFFLGEVLEHDHGGQNYLGLEL